MRLRRTLAALVVVLGTVVAAYLVAGQRFAHGPVLVRLDDQHGVHLSDLAVAGLWALGISVVLWRARDRG